MAAKQQAMRQELVDLSKSERTLDGLIQDCTLQLKHLTEDGTNQRYPSLQAWGYGEGHRDISMEGAS